MRRYIALIALTVLSACNTEIDQSTRPDNLAGTYRLVSWGGTILPAVIEDDRDGKISVLEGQFVLASNGDWSETFTVQSTTNGVTQVAPVTAFGSWNMVRDFAYMSFYDKLNKYQFTGTASGATLVLNTTSGDQLVYRR
ncbi:MAG: hypothetical protein ABJE10_20360 [bacterium]